MALIDKAANHFTVIVTFTTTKENQSQALELIWNYIETFLTKQDGCISSTLHSSFDGKSITNYAQWETAEHFKAFSEKAKSHPDLPAILEFKPHPQFHKIYNSISRQ